jgi:hypothetical protein
MEKLNTEEKREQQVKMPVKSFARAEFIDRT